MIASKLKSMLNSIGFSLFLSLFLIISITIYISGFLSYSHTSTILEAKASEYNQATIRYIDEYLDNYVKQLEEITYFAFQHDTQERLNILSKPNNIWTYLAEKDNFYKSFYNFFSLLKVNSDIRRIFVVYEDGSILANNYGLINESFDFLNADFYRNSLDRDGKVYISVVQSEDYLNFQGHVESPSLLISRKINNLTAYNDLGVLVVVIPWKTIGKTIQEIVGIYTGDLLIYDNDNHIIFNSGQTPFLDQDLSLLTGGNNAYKINFDEKSYIVNVSASNYTELKYLYISSLDEINRDIFDVNKVIYLLIILAFIIAITISVFLSKSIISPIQKLKAYVHQIERGNLNYRIKLNSYEEFNLFGNTLNNMCINLQETIETNYVLNLQNRNSELKALQAQINPHFLYNTLNSINSLVQLDKGEKIPELIHALSDLLRYSFKDVEQMVRIKDEMEHIQNYLYIQNVRYDNKIIADYNIDENILEYKTIRFLLQPLIENALHHGLERKIGEKRIIINGEICEGKVKLEIIDNGVGINEEHLNRLNEILKTERYDINPSENVLFGIGLKNVQQRIKLTFGNEYGISVTSIKGEVTRFHILLPICTTNHHV